MSKETAMFILHKAATDLLFRDQLVRDPYAVLCKLDLTPQEIEALMVGDPERLAACGLDPRIAGWIPWLKVNRRALEFDEN
ncbi:MAG: Os1348 family NHLP clan protein [Chloroflexi bacterium]|nr:Os1348 family NHLP clan protein [Chloroflexota bacterium]MCL5075088.1 Os1348 family NHLP clan protein [Chloroflexota bacterium]